ncbi:hypothetical protein [Sphingobacterium suaedae]|uniref:DUF4350 domain-containing protein n=1 Tax=Sphingobacterium suaedae TaxID=1686402 RepID=A0ABW5KFK7_9SPHI
MKISRIRIISTVGVMLFVTSVVTFGQSVADPHFRVRITDPLSETDKGSLIYFDVAHNNPFSIHGQYKAFADVLRADGYRLVECDEKITRDILTQASLYVSVNALNDWTDWKLANQSVYSEEEIEALYRWVHDDGGSLFLITDHMPAAGAIRSLAGRFGFNVINGFTQRMENQPEMFYRRMAQVLASPATDYRNREVDSLRGWGGSAFLAPKEALVFLQLGDQFRLYLPTQEADMRNAQRGSVAYIDGRHLNTGALLACGKGRVCLCSDGSLFAALLHGVNSVPRGMNDPAAKQHIHLLRNIVQWLDGQF